MPTKWPTLTLNSSDAGQYATNFSPNINSLKLPSFIMVSLTYYLNWSVKNVGSTIISNIIMS